MREEAGELCQTLEENEGKERAASEAADLIYHAMVLLNKQVGLSVEGIVDQGTGWVEGQELPHQASWSCGSMRTRQIHSGWRC